LNLSLSPLPPAANAPMQISVYQILAAQSPVQLERPWFQRIVVFAPQLPVLVIVELVQDHQQHARLVTLENI